LRRYTVGLALLRRTWAGNVDNAAVDNDEDNFALLPPAKEMGLGRVIQSFPCQLNLSRFVPETFTLDHSKVLKLNSV